MDEQMKTLITVGITVEAPADKVWQYWNTPRHITKWASASEDWHTPKAENDLRVGGAFSSRMEAKDGSTGFDFSGIYDEVRENEYIEYTLGDGRKVTVSFEPQTNMTGITQTFEAESTNPEEMQRSGWQAILINFKKYAEEN